MAHWAEINDNNIVIRVTVGDNNDPNGDEGYQWLVENLGGTWIKTSYNGNIRKNYAGIGFTYDSERDAFISPKPYESWILDEATCSWNAPTPQPTDGFTYFWNESELAWELQDFSEPSE
jgi:hypothetical protein